MNTFASLALITIFWPIWLGWLAAFLVVEFTAIALTRKYPDTNNNGGTLSELVWRIIRGPQWYHRLAFVTLLAFFVDLGLHFFLGTPLV